MLQKKKPQQQQKYKQQHPPQRKRKPNRLSNKDTYLFFKNSKIFKMHVYLKR